MMKVRLQPTATPELVDAERRRRLAVGIPFAGGRIQIRDNDRSFITMAMTAARAAIDAGSKTGDYRWQDPEHDFQWIMADNCLVAMDAWTVVEIGQRALAAITALGIAASALKSRLRDGEQSLNIRSNDRWPDTGLDETSKDESNVSN